MSSSEAAERTATPHIVQRYSMAANGGDTTEEKKDLYRPRG